MEVFLLTVAASLAALAGGYIALRGRQWLNSALALTSGLVLGLVTFDLLPEIFDIAKNEKLNPVWPMITLTVGFLLFHVFEKFIPLHEASEQQYGPHRHPRLGTARAIALSGHSFLDGLSIGVGFQVSSAVGTAVALAVIGHRFADGFDTTTFMVFHRNKLSYIKKWLAIYLGFFAGLILYIAASNLIPQAHSEDYSRKSMLLTILGTIFMFIVTRFT
jgi:zinc transporter ZupT